MRLTRFQFGIALLTLLILRLTIGYHFFNEGVSKLESGDFKAEYFLATAKGPLAPHFKQIIEDHDNSRLLSYNKDTGEVDPELSLYIWRKYKDAVAATARFGDESRVGKLKTNREKSLKKIESIRAEISTLDDATDSDDAKSDANSDAKIKAEDKLKSLIGQYEQDEAEILLIRGQLKKANDIYEQYSLALTEYLGQNEEVIKNHFNGQERLNGFEKDGVNRDKAAVEVPSLASQVVTINGDLKKEAGPWTSTIQGMWDNYEADILNVALPADREKVKFPLLRPHDKGPFLKFINAAIPWFDLTVGILLFIGLFTRITALAAAGFLVSIIATQLPWVTGAAPTYYQCVELAGLLVLAGTFAGRIAGLDYFINTLFWNRKTDQTEDA